MLGLDRATARYTWTVVCILLLIGTLYLIRDTLFIFAISILFAYLLWPLVNFLDARIPGHSRIAALTIVYVALIALLTVAGVSIGSRIAGQASALTAQVPSLLSKLDQPPQPAPPLSLQALRNQALALARAQLGAHSKDLVSLASNAALGVLVHMGSLLIIVLVPILGFFFLKDREVIQTHILGSIAPGPRRDRVNDIAHELDVLFAQYMRALVLLTVSAFVAYALFFSVIGVPYGVLLAAIASLLEFIPMVGPLTAAALILTVAGFAGFHHLLWIVLFLAAFRIFQDYVLSPHLLSRGMELHPLLVIFGVLAGASIGGIAGSFLSVPILATLRVLVRQIQKSPSPQ